MIHQFDRDEVLLALAGRFAEFYSKYTLLKPTSGSLRGPCPIHGGTSHNFIVNSTTGLWYCHSQCQAGGDIFEFIKKKDGVSFPDALSRVAEFVGLFPGSLPSQRSAPVYQPPLASSVVTPDLFLETQLAADLHRNLMNSADVRRWLLKQRRLTTETLERFQLGLLPSASKSGEWRICFPIYDRQGCLTNIRKHLFAYKPELTDSRRRVLGKTLPWGKGLRADLFPLSVLDDSDEVLIVEGEADAVLAYQLGFAAVTGTLGAGNWKQHWTEELHGLKRATILYDDDGPGHIGAQKVAASIAPVVSEVRIARYNASGPHLIREGACE